MEKNKKRAWLEFCIKYGNKYNISHFEIEIVKYILDAYFLGKGLIKTIQDNYYSCSVDNLCHYCHKPITSLDEAEVCTAYWCDMWIKYHRSCKHLRKESIILQQKIDCNCNDCTYFKRDGTKFGSAEGGFDFPGQCDKFDKRVTGQSIPLCRVENADCFVHRHS